MQTKKIEAVTIAVGLCAMLGVDAMPVQVEIPEAPFKMPAIPVAAFNDRDYSIVDFGAREGVKATDVFAAAMAACEAAGGGRVVVPKGSWLTGAIRFRSNCNLHLADGATLAFTDDPADYPEVFTTWEGIECYNHSPLIYAFGVTNVAITGKGTIAPRMDFWRTWFARPPEHMKATEHLYYWCSTNAPVEARRLLALDRAHMRPHLIQFNRCGNVLLDGFRIRESPFWMIHLYQSENCIVRNLDTYAHGHNNDGVDIESSRNVLVENCRFDQGDDGIVLKAGRNADGWRIGRPTENVVMRDCYLVNSHSLLGIGSELSGGIRNVWMTRCTVNDTYSMLRIKTSPRRGGFVENIWMDHCRGGRMTRVFNIFTQYSAQWNVFPDFELRRTAIRNVEIADCSAGECRRGLELEGDELLPPEGIRVRNVKIAKVSESLADVRNCLDVTIDGFSLLPEAANPSGCEPEHDETNGEPLPPPANASCVVSDGRCVLETARFQREIDDVAAQGGGRVVVPAGRHVVGQLDLKSNVELHLEKGAVLEGAVGLENYRVTALPYSEGTWSAVVSAIGVTNVAVTGEGEIFGNGTAWPQPEDYGGNQEGLRPRGVFFADCRDVRLSDFAVRDSACWGVVFKCCDGVDARRIRIDSHANANNDGFDVEAKNVVIADCDVDVGDDAVCLKSNTPDFVVENVLVSNVTARSHCNALKLGTASHGTMRNVLFVDCRTEAPKRDFTDRRFGRSCPWYVNDRRPVRFPGVGADEPSGMSALVVENVDGGTVENVTFRRIVANGTCTPIFIRAGTRSGRPCGTPPSDKYVLRDVLLEDVVGESLSAVASSITGVDGCRVKDVTLRNVRIVCRGGGDTAAERTRPVPEAAGKYPDAHMFDGPLPAYGLYARHVDRLALENVSFDLKPGTADGRDDKVFDDVTSPRYAGAVLPWVSEEEREAVRPTKPYRVENLWGLRPWPVGKCYTNETDFIKTNYDEAKAGEPGRDYDLPDPLAFSDGRKVANAADWAARRKEILAIFEREVYGRMPPAPDETTCELLSEQPTEDGFAWERRYRQWFRADRTGPCIDWLVLLPRFAKKPCPVILHLNYIGNDVAASGRTNHFVLPLGEIAARGAAFMSAHYRQISSDGPGENGEPFDGVFELWGPRDPSRTDNTGSIMAWAWGLCRGLDLAERISEIDAGRNMVIGSSRLGKAALLAAAFDERFQVCVPNQTGAIGSHLLRHDFGENIAVQRLFFPWWYCSGVWKWAGREREMPFDQHMLLACVAPRALLVEGFDCNWFDPRGEWLSVKAASPVWEFLTGKGVAVDDWPELHSDVAVRPPLGYARRTLAHGLAPYDWEWALDFAEGVWGK